MATRQPRRFLLLWMQTFAKVPPQKKKTSEVVRTNLFKENDRNVSIRTGSINQINFNQVGELVQSLADRSPYVHPVQTLEDKDLYRIPSSTKMENPTPKSPLRPVFFVKCWSKSFFLRTWLYSQIISTERKVVTYQLPIFFNITFILRVSHLPKISLKNHTFQETHISHLGRVGKSSTQKCRLRLQIYNLYTY